MKRIYAAIIFVVICITVCIWGSTSIEKATDKLIDSLNIAGEEIRKENYKEALVEIRSVKEGWEDNRFVFNSFSRRELTEETDETIDSLEEYFKAEDIKALIVAINRCRNQLEEIYKWQRIAMSNIL